MPLRIDPITTDDLPALLDLIRELARFERLEHELEATVDRLREAIFGPDAVAGALFARQNGELVGYAIYFFTFSSFTGRRGIWLDDIFVRPAFRRQGIGRALIAAVGKIGVTHHCQRYEWTALNWNNVALDSYRKLGARLMSDWVLLRLDGDNLKRLAAQGGHSSDSSSMTPT